MKYKKMRTYTQLTWEEWYCEAEKYFLKYGHLRIPGKYKTENGLYVGRWIERQRSAYHGHGKYKIDESEIYRLNQIGMEWEIRDRIGWDGWYKIAQDFKQKNGNINVSSSRIINGKPLGEWLKQQRKYYRSGKLTRERKELLERLGVEWSVKKRLDKTQIG